MSVQVDTESLIPTEVINFVRPNDVIICVNHPGKTESLGPDMSSQLGLRLVNDFVLPKPNIGKRDSSQPFMHIINLNSKTAEQLKTIKEVIGQNIALSLFILHEKDDLNNKLIGGIRESCTFTSFFTTYDKTVKRVVQLIDRVRMRENAQKRSSGPKLHESRAEDVGIWTHFLSLTAPNVRTLLPYMNQLRIGVDALELRVDLLKDRSVQFLHSQIALLRDCDSSSDLKLVYTVRTKQQIGQYPDEDFDGIAALLTEGLRAGVEWLDVEACLPTSVLQHICALVKGPSHGSSRFYGLSSHLLGSLHVTTPQSVSQIQLMFQQCDLSGHADMLKVVTGAENEQDCVRVHEVGAAAGKPYIGLCLGAAGALSRVLNKRFTPVTHKLLTIAAPGQLTAEELMSRRVAVGLLSPRMFYLFGSPIQQSLSPAMHNGAFDVTLLPHRYHLKEETDVTAYREVIAKNEFGGASVTIPHKESIIPLLDEVRGPAAVIGAVNTIVPEWNDRGERRLVGFNTDWVGMQRPIRRLLAKKSIAANEGRYSGVGLVIGAGGTARAACFALLDLGLKLIVSNRCPEKAIALAERFGGTYIPLDELEDKIKSELMVVISTVPAAANFTMPAMLLQQQPVVLDVVYKPANTALIAQAKAYGAPFVQGATMLLEQGIEQFQLWHNRPAPRAVMQQAVGGKPIANKQREENMEKPILEITTAFVKTKAKRELNRSC